MDQASWAGSPRPYERSTRLERRLTVLVILVVALFLCLALLVIFMGQSSDLKADLQLSVHENWLGDLDMVVVTGTIYNTGDVDGHAIVHLRIFTGYETKSYEVDAGLVPKNGSSHFSWIMSYSSVDPDKAHFLYSVKEYDPPTPGSIDVTLAGRERA
jgi:hypothetical protein